MNKHEINETISNLESALSTAKFHAERLEETISSLKNLSHKEALSGLEQRFVARAVKKSEEYNHNIDYNGDEMNNAFHTVYDAMDDYLND